MMTKCVCRSHIYIVRTWREAWGEIRPEDREERGTAQSTAQSTVRGMVRDLHSGETRYFSSWEFLVAFLTQQEKSQEEAYAKNQERQEGGDLPTT